MLVARLWSFFFFSSRRRHTRYWRDWSSDVCSSDLTDVKSWDINDYLEAISGGADITAKDFRTWSATVLCSVALAVSEQAVTSPSAAKRAVTRAVKETAHYLGKIGRATRLNSSHANISYAAFCL